MPPVETYQRALRGYADARRELAAILDAVRAVGKVFDGWNDSDPRSYNGSLSRLLAEWSQTQRLPETVVRWQAAATEMNRAWEAIDADSRLGLVAPDQFKP